MSDLAKFIDLDLSPRLVDLDGCWERSVEKQFRGNTATLGPDGEMNLASIIGTPDGIYLLRAFSIARPLPGYLVRIQPRRAAEWLMEAGIFDLPPDLEQYARP